MIENDLEDIICCPICKSDLEVKKITLKCNKCDQKFLFNDGIYIFNQNIQSKVSKYFKDVWLKNIANIDNYIKPKISHIIDSNEINEITSPLKDKILLDAGCGLGLSTIRLLKVDAKIIFLDIITESLIFIKKFIEKQNIQGRYLLIAADIVNLPLKSNSIDVIWSGGVLEHFRSIAKPYFELYRVLKGEGDILFTIPNKFGLQRILSSIKEIILGPIENHYEKGFVYSHLDNFFPKKLFISYRIRDISFQTIIHCFSGHQTISFN